ncbi:uncharacterized protein LOC142999637 [Genypterus blacodes]|uniref:uncharacterized protein LOC142999637 n=1 Tax=Genypterus blacodes TaxID=154954 RepID=UPI003F764A23
MILIWLLLLLIHEGYTLMPVTTVQLDEPATFTCVVTDEEYSNTRIKWYKQSTGGNLILISTLMKSVSEPILDQMFEPSRFKAIYVEDISNLTILRTTREDEAIYHCAISSWRQAVWSGTYLSVKGNSLRTSDLIIVQEPTVSDPVHPGDSVSLQCSVLSGSKDEMCPDRSVFWFKAGSDKSHPDIIYTNINPPDRCESSPGAHSSLKSCVYSFSKNVSSSDAGTYYCAVATCGEIWFGNGTKLDIEANSLCSVGDLWKFVFSAYSAISVIVIAALIQAIKTKACCKELQTNTAAARGDQWSQQVGKVIMDRYK